jgi:hypothetical protein
MSKLKVGNWVRYTTADNTKAIGQVLSIDDNFMHIGIDDTIYYRFDLEHPISVELWRPKVSEWYFDNYHKEFLKVKSAERSGLGVGSINLHGKQFYSAYKSCEPFRGELPSWLKETK